MSPDWVEVSSAGTLDIAGARPPGELREIAQSRDVDLSTFRSVPIVDANPRDADLVIRMTLDHVATTVVNGGADPETSFTITEFVRLLELYDPEPTHSRQEAAAIVARAHSSRTEQKGFVPADDIEDPMGGPRKGYETMADQLEDLCARLVSGMGWS